MSTPSKLAALQAFLVSQGFVPDEDYDIAGDGVSIIVSVRIPDEPRELPEVLKPFAYTPDDVERAMRKGSAEKRTFNGAEFELALTEYAHHLLHQDPACMELEKTLDTLTSPAEFAAYKAARQAIWERITTTPELQELDRQLAELL